MAQHGSIERFNNLVYTKSSSINDGLDFHHVSSTPYRINGNEVANIIQAVGGIQALSSSSSEFESDVLIGTIAGGAQVYGSTDGGASWLTISSGSSGFVDVHLDIVGGNGDLLMSKGSSILGIGGLSNLYINGSTTFFSAVQTIGDIGSPGVTAGDGVPIRCGFDPIENYFWAAGENTSNGFSMGYKTVASGISNATGWTTQAGGLDGSDQMCRAIATGPDGSGSSWVVFVDNTNRYYFGEGSISAARTYAGGTLDIVDLNSVLSFNNPFKQVLYNSFWNQYIFMGNLSMTGATPACVVVDPANIGSTTASHYTTRTVTRSRSNFTNINLQDGGAAVAVGPWCYFQTDKGGSGSGIACTPDMGKTWYTNTFMSNSSGGDDVFITSMGKYRGSLTFVTSSVDATDDFSSIYRTSRIEEPPVAAAE